MVKTKVRFIDTMTGEILHENVGGLNQVSQMWDAYLTGDGKGYNGMIIEMAKYTKYNNGKIRGIDAYVGYPEDIIAIDTDK